MAALIITGAVELQQMTQDLMSEGKVGKKVFRKGLRAGTKVIAKRVKETFPQHTGEAAKSVKVKALKRKKGRIGFRVSLFAASKAGFPYPLGLEGGVKVQPAGSRIRKKVKRVTRNGRGLRMTDEAASTAYHSLTWRIEPQHNMQKEFDDAASQASNEIMTTCVDELEKIRVK